MGVKVAIGLQSFEKIRENNIFYVDKTDFIKDWWEKEDSVTLITRPRRFGKTLNMSMVECFFSNRYRDRGELFEGLSIWEEEEYRKLQGTLPVLFLSFAKVKAQDYEEMQFSIASIIFEVYQKNSFLMDGGYFERNRKKVFSKHTAGNEP